MALFFKIKLMGWIYCLLSLRYFYFKIGLSGKPKRRRKNITKSIKEVTNKSPWIIPVFGVWVWDMDRSEAKIHRVIKFWNFTWKGSGKTEWFKSKLFFIDGLFALLVALVFMLLMWIELIIILTSCAALVYYSTKLIG